MSFTRALEQQLRFSTPRHFMATVTTTSLVSSYDVSSDVIHSNLCLSLGSIQTRKNFENIKTSICFALNDLLLKNLSSIVTTMPKGRKNKKKKDSSDEEREESPVNVATRSKCRKESLETVQPSTSGAQSALKKKNLMAKGKKTSSPRKLNKNKGKGEPLKGATAKFVEDDNVVVMKTTTLENREFPDPNEEQAS